MSDRKLSILELHFDGPIQIGPGTTGGAARREATGDADAESDADAGPEDAVEFPTEGVSPGAGTRATVAKAAVALAVLAAAALGARRLLGGEDAADLGDGITPEFDPLSGDEGDEDAAADADATPGGAVDGDGGFDPFADDPGVGPDEDAEV